MPSSTTSQTSQSTQTTIAQQTEQDAAWYPPAVYQGLTYWGSLLAQNDPQASNYTPYTSALRGMSTLSPQANFLPFIIGLIPPSAPPGQALNPSASVGALTTIANFLPAPVPSQIAPSGGQGSRSSDGTNNGGPANYQTFTDAQRANMILQGFGQNPPDLNTVLMLTAQSKVEQPGQIPDYNPGGLGFSKTGPKSNTFSATSNATNATAGSTYYFSSYGSAASGGSSYVGTISRFPGTLSSASAGDPTGYVQALANGPNGSYFGNGSTATYTAGVTNNYNALVASGLTLDQIRAASPPQPPNNVTENPVPGGVSTQTGTPAPTWNASGAPNAQQSAQSQAATAGTLLSQQQSTLNTNILNQQQAQITATTQAIAQMAATPPLQMLVSPTSFKYNTEKVVADGSWGRNGPIIEHWGNQQEKIEGSGKLAAFFALDNNPLVPSPNQPNINNDGPGLTRMARNYSMSYQNFLSLYLIYKNNGGVYLQDAWSTAANSGTASGSTAITRTNLSMLGSVYIYYDSTMYIGSFDNFTISETADAPFTLEYSFTFTVRAWFLLDQPTNPLLNQFGGGSPSISTVSAPNLAVNSAVQGIGNAAGSVTGGVL